MNFYKVKNESIRPDHRTVWRILAIAGLISVMSFALFWNSIWLKGHWFWDYQNIFLPAIFVSLISLLKFRPAWFTTPRRAAATGVCAGLLISIFAHLGSAIFDPYGIEKLYNTYIRDPESIKYLPMISLLLVGWLFGGSFSLILFIISRMMNKK